MSTEDPFQKISHQEKLPITVEVAQEKDWQEYRDLRLLSITGKDAEMFAATPEMVKREKAMDRLDWQQYFSKAVIFPMPDRFVVLSHVGSEPIAIGVASEREKWTWHLSGGYVKEGFRGVGVGKKIIAERLREILKRGGKMVTVKIKVGNDVSLRNCQAFGFEIVSTKSKILESGVEFESHLLELDLTNPEVITKLYAILNA